jgi:hypothetical protein
VLFPQNVALALAVAESLGIRRAKALDGMLKALPDPGALRINYLNPSLWHNSVFVNGFAANEPKSSLTIWSRILENDRLPLVNPIILFNGRPDRVDRTKQFVEDFFPRLKNVTLVAMGQSIQSIKKAMEDGLFPGVVKYFHMENYPGKQVAEELRRVMHHRLLFGVGNIHGDAEELIDLLLVNKLSAAPSYSDEYIEEEPLTMDRIMRERFPERPVMEERSIRRIMAQHRSSQRTSAQRNIGRDRELNQQDLGHRDPNQRDGDRGVPNRRDSSRNKTGNRESGRRASNYWELTHRDRSRQNLEETIAYTDFRKRGRM